MDRMGGRWRRLGGKEDERLVALGIIGGGVGVVRARAQIRQVLMADASVGWRNDFVSTPVHALLTKNAGDRAGGRLGAEGDVGRTTRIGGGT